MSKSESTRAETVTFVAKILKADPNASFGDIKKKAKAEGHNVYPLIIGLARKELGWAPSAKAKAAKKAKTKKAAPAAAAATGAAPVKRGPGRPPKAKPAAAVATGDAAGALAAIERQFREMREALRAITAVASKF